MSDNPPPPSLEAKLVVLGSQGVGKTSLLHRFEKNAFIPPNQAQSTCGASFTTARVFDAESSTTIVSSAHAILSWHTLISATEVANLGYGWPRTLSFDFETLLQRCTGRHTLLRCYEQEEFR